MLCGLCHAHQELFHPFWKLCFCLKLSQPSVYSKKFPIRYGEFYYVEIVLEFSNLLYGDFSQWFGFSNPCKWPTCMDWKIQGTGSLINILQLFLFPDLNIFVKWTHKSNKNLRLKLSFNFQQSVIHSRIKLSHCT